MSRSRRPDSELAPIPAPPDHRSWLRRNARWLVPLAVLAVAPLPVGLAGLGVGMLLGAWVGVRVVARRRRHRGEDAARGRGGADDIHLGVDGAGRRISLDADQLGAHGLILGASGSGKSTTLLSIVGQQILAGRPVVAVDLKGSPEFAQSLAEAAAAAGRPFRLWSLDGPEHWNPLAHGNPTELKDRLMRTEHFSEPHYKRAAERYLQTAVGVLAESAPGREPNLRDVVELLDPRALRDRSRRLSPVRAAAVDTYVAGLSRDQLSAVQGLQSRLAVLSESHSGAFLAPAPGAIDLRRALDGPEVVLFSLNSSTYGELAAQLGSLVVADLVSAGGARERGTPTPRPATVALDEFSGLGADHVGALIARGRSAGLSVLLATQELADLDRVSRGFRQQVVGSTAVKIVHRQDVGDSALEVSRLAGSERVWEASYSAQAGRRGSRPGSHRVQHRLVERARVDPSTVQSLRTGEAVLMTKVPSSQTRLARIQPLSLSSRAGSSPRRDVTPRQR